MGFKFASFGAATVPLSKIIVDKDLDMGPYAIKGVYRPEEWSTEELDWGDGEPVTSVGAENLETYSSSSYTYTTLLTADAPCEIVVRLVDLTGYALNAPVLMLADEVAVRTGPVLYPGDSYTFEPVILNTGDVLKLRTRRLSPTGYGAAIISRVELINTGRVVGDTTLDLSGKWLALEQDFGTFSADIKIQGVEMPFSDYPLYFPIAPSEITIYGTWSPTVERPVIKVYNI